MKSGEFSSMSDSKEFVPMAAVLKMLGRSKGGEEGGKVADVMEKCGVTPVTVTPWARGVLRLYRRDDVLRVVPEVSSALAKMRENEMRQRIARGTENVTASRAARSTVIGKLDEILERMARIERAFDIKT